jgi:hypothetical protein
MQRHRLGHCALNSNNYPLQKHCLTGIHIQANIPLNDLISVQAGTFHSLTVPDQLPVAKTSLFGAKRTCDIGRSSPIWEPRLAYFW